MGQFLSVLKLILQILPHLIEATKSIESAIPQAKAGEEKLAIVQGIVKSAYEQAEGTLPALAVIQNAVGGVVSLLVGSFNRLSIFKH